LDQKSSKNRTGCDFPPPGSLFVTFGHFLTKIGPKMGNRDHRVVWLVGIPYFGLKKWRKPTLFEKTEKK